LPSIRQGNLHGGVIYYDGQFDDSRLAINLAQTCLEQGATVLNYFRVTNLLKADDKICGVVAKDEELGIIYQIKGKVVINATGVFVDDLLQKDEPHKKPLVKSSQGIHVVIDKSFMPGEAALMIPKTDDGRVLFVVPWHGKLLIGTTDTPLDEHTLEPRALAEEIEFILRNAGKYLTKAPRQSDILSVFAGLRPLAAPREGSTETKEISRSHKIIVSVSGLITITGGKWTTYRRMAQDTIDKAIETAGLPPQSCVTKDLPIHGCKNDLDWNNHLYVYGSDIEQLLSLIDENPDWARKLHPEMDYIGAEIIWAMRHEMAHTVEDVLARRVRALFRDARVAIEMAPKVASLMAVELRKDKTWENNQIMEFIKVAEGYLPFVAR
jgi:glycerol-3-phosphate dehydrogenase